MTRPSDSGASGVDWGAEIIVNGKRPEWLADDVRICWAHKDGSLLGHRGQLMAGDLRFGPWVTAIRLPADHPHYRQPQPQPQPADTVTVGRRTVGEWEARFGQKLGDLGVHMFRELDLLKPEPVDPDIAAADAVLEEYQDATSSEYAGRLKEMARGLALAAIKRGRALATAEKALAWGEGE